MNTSLCLEESFHKHEHEGHARVRFAWNDPNIRFDFCIWLPCTGKKKIFKIMLSNYANTKHYSYLNELIFQHSNSKTIILKLRYMLLSVYHAIQ